VTPAASSGHRRAGNMREVVTPISPHELLAIFQSALPKHVKLSIEACEPIAAELQRRTQPRSPSHLPSSLFREFLVRGDQFSLTLEKLLEFIPLDERDGGTGGFPWAELEQCLVKFGIVPLEPAAKARGRPHEQAGFFAPALSRLIKDALRHSSFRGSQGFRTEDVVVQIGAGIMTRAFGVKLGPSGFRSYLAKRDRRRKTKPPSFSERIKKHENRIRVLG
jgi:hypothetical protein